MATLCVILLLLYSSFRPDWGIEKGKINFVEQSCTKPKNLDFKHLAKQPIKKDLIWFLY